MIAELGKGNLRRRRLRPLAWSVLAAQWGLGYSAPALNWNRAWYRVRGTAWEKGHLHVSTHCAGRGDGDRCMKWGVHLT